MDPDFQELAKELTEAVGRLAASQTQIRYKERWSIQQIVEHLTLTYASTAVVVKDRLAKGRATQAKPTLMQQCACALILRLRYFPRGRAAPPAVTPLPNAQQLSGAELVERAIEQVRELDGRLDEAALLFGPDTKSVSHFILGPLSPREWRRFHLVHGRHHLRQIRRLLRAPV